MTSNEHIQSVLAKAITDVSFVHSLEASTGNGRLLGNVDRIVEFSAFIAKVQHNFLWGDFRCSFGLLHEYGFEIAIFTDYLPFHQDNKKRARMTPMEKTDRFIGFLKAWLLSKKGRKYATIHYVLTHEDSIRRLKAEAKLLKTKRSRSGPVTPESVAVINGCCHVHDFTITTEPPERTAPAGKTRAALSGKKTGVSVQKGNYVYWIAGPKKELEIITITKEVAAILKCIEASETIGAMVAKVDAAFGEHTALDVLELLYRYKIIYLK